MRVERDGAPVALTPTEYRLLRHLVTSPDRVFSRETLLEIVWGYDSSVDSQRTVDVHMRHLREKLEEDPASAALARDRAGHGLHVLAEAPVRGPRVLTNFNRAANKLQPLSSSF